MQILMTAVLFMQDEPARPPSEFAPLIKIEGKIEWFGSSYEEALEEAEKTGKLVLVHLLTHW